MAVTKLCSSRIGAGRGARVSLRRKDATKASDRHDRREQWLLRPRRWTSGAGRPTAAAYAADAEPSAIPAGAYGPYDPAGSIPAGCLSAATGLPGSTAAALCRGGRCAICSAVCKAERWRRQNVCGRFWRGGARRGARPWRLCGLQYFRGRHDHAWLDDDNGHFGFGR